MIGSSSHLIDTLDLSIFSVPSSTTPNDKRSLLSIQKMVGNIMPAGFTYLEIGSYLGGTLLPYLLDDRCTHIVSIDKRPNAQPDERARQYFYGSETTDLMRDTLRPYVNPAQFDKLVTYECDASALDKSSFATKIDVALIDGEHTNVATISDFLQILDLLSPNGIIVFHDVNLIGDALQAASLMLRYKSIDHSLTILPDVVGVLALRNSAEEVTNNLTGAAIEPVSFFLKSKQALREEIAASVALGLHFGVA